MMNSLGLLCLFKELCSIECTSQKKCQKPEFFEVNLIDKKNADSISPKEINGILVINFL